MKEVINKIFFLALISIFLLSFVSAASQTVSLSPTTGEAGVFHLYNFTINNTDSSWDISEVDINFFSLTIDSATAGSSTGISPTVVDSYLSFGTHPSTLIAVGATQYFWVNAKSANTGDFNINVASFDNQSTPASVSENKTVTISDTTFPEINFVSPTPSSGSTLNSSYIPANVTAIDAGGLKNITVYLYDSGRALIDSRTHASSPFFYNFTSLGDGTYYLNATAYDNAGNSTSTSTRTIELDTAPACTPNWVCSWGECLNDTQSQVCSDSNNCGVTTGKPSGTQACVSCITEWDCTAWSPSTCSTGSNQTRLCTDSNACVAPETETRSCVITSASNQNASGNSLFSSSFLFFIVLGAIILSVGGVIFILMRLKKKSASSDSGSDNSGYTTYPPRGPPPSSPPPSYPPAYMNPPRLPPPNFRPNPNQPPAYPNPPRTY